MNFDESPPTPYELAEISKNKIGRFKPSFEPIVGFRYNSVERHSLTEQIYFLKSLSELGIVSRKPGQCIMMCPSCKFHNFNIRFVCTICRSPNFLRGNLIKHDLCGNIDFDFNYFTADKTLTCRKCNKKLQITGLDHSKQEDFYKCLECKATFPNIEKLYLCLHCGESFCENELDLLQLPIFQVDSSRLLNILNDGNSMLSVVNELGKIGVKSVCPDSIIGLSQVAQLFDLVVYDQNNQPILVVDILEQDEGKSAPDPTYSYQRKQEMLVLSFIAKCADAATNDKILVAIPGLKKKLKLLTNFNGITLIESETKVSAISSIIKEVTRAYSQFENIKTR